MLITVEITDPDWVCLIHSFLEHTDPDYDLTYVIMYMVDGEPCITPYSKMPWPFVRDIICKIINITGSVMVTIFSGDLLGGIIDGRNLDESY